MFYFYFFIKQCMCGNLFYLQHFYTWWIKSIVTSARILIAKISTYKCGLYVIRNTSWRDSPFWKIFKKCPIRTIFKNNWHLRILLFEQWSSQKLMSLKLFDSNIGARSFEFLCLYHLRVSEFAPNLNIKKYFIQI